MLFSLLLVVGVAGCAELSREAHDDVIAASWTSSEALKNAGRAVIVSSVTVANDVETAGTHTPAILSYASPDAESLKHDGQRTLSDAESGPRVYSNKPIYFTTNIVAGRFAVGSIMGESGPQRFFLPLATLLSVGLIDGGVPQADLEVAPGEVLYIGDLAVTYGEEDALTGLITPRPYTFTTTSNFDAAKRFLEEEHPALAGSLKERLLICRSCAK
jgi:hypothetical protein